MPRGIAMRASRPSAGCSEIAGARLALGRGMDEQARFPGLYALLTSTVLFSLIDAVLTMAVVLAGLAIEANPLMAALLHHGPIWFVLGKTALVGGGVAVLWRFRRRPLALPGAAFACGCYAVVLVHHGRSVTVLAEWLTAL